tara:strand:+ start:535 stop:669 length:135 start_codon:yes stop_codon:yes gene_type:complete
MSDPEPNEETKQAMEEADSMAGQGQGFNSLDELLKALESDQQED